MSEPFLILHKVRGEPAFDIAEMLEMDDDVWWIIPTSGHRAYVAHGWRLDSLTQPNVLGNLNLEYIANPQLVLNDEQWASLPDHYAASEKRSMLTTAASDILSLMGIRKAPPQEPVKRRSIP
jgi:hypothetical protein